jgi:hypothetical protein
MKSLWNLLPFYVSGLAGVFCVALWGAWLLVQGRRKLRPPQEDDLLRPPGHTLAEKLAAHPERLVTPGFAVFLGSSLTGASLWALLVWAYHLWTNEEARKLIAEKGFAALWASRGFAPAAITVALLLLGGVGFVLWGRHYVREWLRERHRLRMGLRGEQAVAEELQAAVRAGYHVFHDLPGEKGNIDHVAVGPGGVFAIETKARSKREKPGAKAEHWAEFDGNQVRFSDGWLESKAVRQAEAIATALGKTLSSSTGHPVTVCAVIALPGWWVKPNHFTKVVVRNPRYFAKELVSAPRTLSDPEIARVVHQLDQACRTVSFEEQ